MPISAPEPLLEVSGLSSGYGKIGVLRGIDLRVGAGEAVALLGPNGAGEDLAARRLRPAAALRHHPLCGKDMAGASPRDTVQAGLVHVVEVPRVHAALGVRDLLLAGYGMKRDERATQVEEALALFPEIAEKRADRAITLSGGQQQMLAVAQGLVRRPAPADAGRSLGRPVRPSWSTACSPPPPSCATPAPPSCWSSS